MREENVKSILYAATALCAVIAAPAWAEEAATPLDTVVVTVERTPEQTSRIGGQVTVLDATTLEQQQTPIVSDILARTPGISFSRDGGVGGQTQLNIRGAETDQTVVLIDGVKLNDPTDTGGGYNFANLLLGDVSRIEVLRGPQSVLWGSQAIGGVINIITDQPTKPLEGHLQAETGSNAWDYINGAVGGKTDRVTWRASAAYLTTAGISAFDSEKGGREADGYTNVGASGTARVALTENLSLDLRAVYSRGRNDFDGFPAPLFVFADDSEYGTTEDMVGYAGLNLDLLGGRFRNRLAYGYTHTIRQNFDPTQAVTTTTFDATGQNDRLEYQGTFDLTKAWTAVFGAENERSSMRSSSPSSFDPSPTPIRRSAELTGVYAQVHGEVLPGLTLSGGLRHDSDSDFGEHTLGQASAAWALNDGSTILRASWGQGFKAPSLYQLGSEYGNPNLQPEQAEGWDAGVEQHLLDGRIMVSAAYFSRKTTNEIDFISCTTGSPDPKCLDTAGLPRFGYYANIDAAQAHGVELQGEAKLTDALTLDANYTWTDATNQSAGPNDGKRLSRRPEHQAYAEASYRWPDALSTAVAVRYAGDSYDDVANTTLLKAYTLVDLRASYPINSHLEVYGRIENLFDQHYETIFDYGQLGRAAYVGVRARF
jgi:vitamin B12 transporter